MSHMRKSYFLLAVICVAVLVLPGTLFSTDVDGGDDCVRFGAFDYGDAPEGIPAYPISAPAVIGAFPTCVSASAVIGTQEIAAGCTPISTPPGPTGYIEHFNYGGFGTDGEFWLGCYTDAQGNPMGIDDDSPAGKVNTPSVGSSVCGGNPTDCVETAEGTFDQDECIGDGSDSGLPSRPTLVACESNSFAYNVYACAPVPQAIELNIFVDWNQDGDWNDCFLCPDGSYAYEWAVKHAAVTVVPGCNSLMTPAFLGGPYVYDNVWMRITIGDSFPGDDMPWYGARNLNGETEDYLVAVEESLPVQQKTWGGIKSLFGEK